jgi:NADPH:quinone reductase-like Zn-dependent oxidoreductase
MQTDIRSAQLAVSGIAFVGSTRLKGIGVSTTSTALVTLTIWDSLTTPTGATYERAGTTVTVELITHGVTVGQRVGIRFSSDGTGQGTSGNYTVATVPDPDHFTVVDIASGTVAALTACDYLVSSTTLTPFLVTLRTAAVISNVFFNVPGEGIPAKTGLYLTFGGTGRAFVLYG